jgi:glutaminyl-peptide cyclotransferase
MIFCKKIPFYLFILFALFTGCVESKKQTKIFSISLQENHSRVVTGTELLFNYTTRQNVHIDSIQAFANGTQLTYHIQENSSISLSIPSTIIGRQSISLNLFFEENTENFTFQVTVFSDITPERRRARVIGMHNHDIEAYTQGLEFYNGILYESTGLYGKSTIRKVDLETGNVILSKDIPAHMFGEGLTIVGDTLFQLTWKEQTGFMYKAHTLEKIGEFQYNTEGWGLCYNGEHLIMTDGSEYLYFHSLPPAFLRVQQIPVYDNMGPVRNLNELEYIDGYVYANVYTTDEIVKIDPKTGKVHQRIDLSGILPHHMRHENIDVLNGIAYDRKNNRIFVTGKNWPKLFEVEF